MAFASGDSRTKQSRGLLAQMQKTTFGVDVKHIRITVIVKKFEHSGAVFTKDLTQNLMIFVTFNPKYLLYLLNKTLFSKCVLFAIR